MPRYQTMKGRRVERRFGWDCHGLPAEVEAEKQLGIEHKNEIEAMGVAAFNDACKTSVLRYTKDWQDYVARQARWVDFENDYKTLDLSYMESVMWAFKTLYQKGLVYEGFRVLWYCWRCETPLSNTETKMDDVYKTRQDPAVTVGLELNSDEPALQGVKALVWTTTPWTLPSNLADAVHPDVDYGVVEARSGNGAERGTRGDGASGETASGRKCLLANGDLAVDVQLDSDTYARVDVIDRATGAHVRNLARGEFEAGTLQFTVLREVADRANLALYVNTSMRPFVTPFPAGAGAHPREVAPWWRPFFLAPYTKSAHVD